MEIGRVVSATSQHLIDRYYDPENMRTVATIKHELWPLDEIDMKKDKFPCCLVWTPLPVVSWLAPFIGQIGICREDGVIIDFSGSNFVNADNFSFGSVARVMDWNMINVAGLILSKGHWVNKTSVVRSFLPFGVVLSVGVKLAGWPFIIGLLSFSTLLVRQVLRNLLYCPEELKYRDPESSCFSFKGWNHSIHNNDDSGGDSSTGSLANEVADE